MNFCLDEKIFEIKKVSKLNRFYNIIELTEKDLIFNSTTQYPSIYPIPSDSIYLQEDRNGDRLYTLKVLQEIFKKYELTHNYNIYFNIKNKKEELI